MGTRRALVTGGTRGIGAATVIALIEAGDEVIVTGRSPSAQVPQGCRYLTCDLAHPKALREFSRIVEGLDISVLINNAGINKIGAISEYDVDDFNRIQHVNVTAPFVLCKAAIPSMQRRQFGRIVNITSIFSVVSKPGRSAYSASKSGLLGLTRALALEVAADNILINCVAPGIVDTELTHSVLGDPGIAELRSLVPMGRLATSDEIAKYIRFLASEENTYMTGQNLVVDGGFTCA